MRPQATTPRDLPHGASKVQAFLVALGSSAKVVELPESSATADDAAAALGVEVGRIAKSFLALVDSRPVVFVLAGDQRVGFDKVKKVLAADTVTSLRANEVKRVTGFPIGGVCPFALPEEITVVVDTGLDSGRYFVAAGHPRCVVGLSRDELVKLSGGRVLEVASERE